MSKIKEFIKKHIPFYALILFFIALLCAVVHSFAIFIPAFADFFNRTVSVFFRFIFAKLTGWLPISFAEIMIICLPIIIGLLIFFMVRAIKKGKGVRFFCGFFAVISLFYSTFVLTFACGYRGYSIDSKLELERTKVSASELEFTTRTVMVKLNALVPHIKYGEDDFSNMPYDFDELNDKLNEAYKKFTEKYDFMQDMRSNVKPIILSEPMTYTHISGVYTYFTGEANVNTNYPEYNLPYTMAHEMAHQRGIAPENEANFIAFLVCIESDDPYIQYSAYFNMFEYLSSALYSANTEMYRGIQAATDDRIFKEMIAYSKFFDKYRENIAANVSGAVNNSYLVSQGQTAGTKSYGLVVDLAVAYYKKG